MHCNTQTHARGAQYRLHANAKQLQAGFQMSLPRPSPHQTSTAYESSCKHSELSPEHKFPDQEGAPSLSCQAVRQQPETGSELLAASSEVPS